MDSRAIAELTARQLHVVTARQLIDSGLSRHQVARRVQAGALRPLHPGVFMTVGGRPTFEQRALAAALACGPGAFVSHAAAAALWGLSEVKPPRIDVTVPMPRDPRVRDVVVHRSKLFGPVEQTRKDPFPIARPARALIDLAGVTDRPPLELAVDEALRRGLVSVASLDAYASHPSRRKLPGSGRLRELIADRAHGVPESVLETKTLQLIRRYGLPEPQRQYVATLNGRTVRFDFAYPELLLAIEVYGRAPHSTPERWQSDHERDNAIEFSDWKVLKFTWADVTSRPLHVVLTIADALGLVPARWKNAG